MFLSQVLIKIRYWYMMFMYWSLRLRLLRGCWNGC